MNKRLYTGEPLEDDEWLLKLAPDVKTGFLTKLTQKGQLPKAFDEWREGYMYGYINGVYSHTKTPKLPVYIHKEKPSEGWTLERWRIGKSQEWATMIHPEGFTVEIYLTNFLELVKENTIINGIIQGKFKWENHKLVK